MIVVDQTVIGGAKGAKKNHSDRESSNAMVWLIPLPILQT
jgi:hypothetical protein